MRRVAEARHDAGSSNDLDVALTIVEQAAYAACQGFRAALATLRTADESVDIAER